MALDRDRAGLDHGRREDPGLLEAELATLRLPDLSGKSVLDVGAWDGYYSFMAERAGASRVVALDYYTWSVDLPAFRTYGQTCAERGIVQRAPHEVPELWRPDELPGKRGFDLAHELLGSGVDPLVGDLLDLDPAVVGQFDVVLCLGVIYHLQNPFLAVEQLRRITREVAVVESEAIHVPEQEHVALWQFHGVDHLGGGPGNWWVPNRLALEHVLQAGEFGSVETVGSSQFHPSEHTVSHYRTTVHARP